MPRRREPQSTGSTEFRSVTTDGNGPTIGDSRSGSGRLYGLLDALIALRLEFADGTAGDKAVSAISRDKVVEIQASLDVAIHSIKRALDEVEHPHPPRRTHRLEEP